jgi:clan AA aspartic protease (TIGR02281 family)
MRILIMLVAMLTCGAVRAESIPLIHAHGTFLVPVLINDKITLNFTIDSGASDVSIPADVFLTLTRAGTISKSDFLDGQIYELADGSRQSSQRFRIRSLRIGDLELRDVVASVAPIEGSLLLGQSFLSRIKSWSIDNEHHLLVLNESPAGIGTKPVTVSAAPSSHSVSASPVDNNTFLKAVAFALTGDDSTHVSDWDDCVFQIKVGAPISVLTFHLNNVDPARIRVAMAEQSATETDVRIFGEGVVVDEYGPDPNSATAPKVLTHHTQWSVLTHTSEYDRLLRAWKYIYSHGCTGHTSSF